MSLANPTAIIAEDEAPQRAELAALLAELWPELSILAQCADGASAKAALETLKPDVAFLDIRMPSLSGLEAARHAPSAHIIFITAFDQFAVQAFEDGAADYLLKPVMRKRLAQALSRVRARLSEGKAPDMAALIDLLETRFKPAEARTRWIAASAGGVTRMIAIEDVLFFQAQDKLTRVVTRSGEAHIRLSLKELAPKLDPEEFWQVHRGAIVKVAAIRSVKRDEDGKLKLSIEGKVEMLPVSAQMAHRFRGM